MRNNGISHVKSAPFHPSSNGLAERAVQTFKESMKKVKGDTLETRLSGFLFKYLITPYSTTGLSPAEMLLARRDLLSIFSCQILKPKCCKNNKRIMTKVPSCECSRLEITS